MWSAFAALAVTLVLLAAVLAMRVRLLRRLARERGAAARWIPWIARCAEEVAATLPRLSRRDADHFVLLWCRAQTAARSWTPCSSSRISGSAASDGDSWTTLPTSLV